MKYKKDTNHNAIAYLFQSYGYIVIDTSWSRGKLLDFIAYKRTGEVWFVEVKNGAKKKLTDDEMLFFSNHPERSISIHSTDEARSVLAHIEARF